MEKFYGGKCDFVKGEGWMCTQFVQKIIETIKFLLFNSCCSMLLSSIHTHTYIIVVLLHTLSCSTEEFNASNKFFLVSSSSQNTVPGSKVMLVQRLEEGGRWIFGKVVSLA